MNYPEIIESQLKSKRSISEEKFITSPFSILNARGQVWQKRKKAWGSLGIRGEVGRVCDSGKYSSGSLNDPTQRKGDDFVSGAVRSVTEEASPFDPVLTEFIYQHYSPEGAQIIDPFAGGPVRGLVASFMSRAYWGCDLRHEQIQANQINYDDLFEFDIIEPRWVVGDTEEEIDRAPDADLIFSCPPYGSLEKYSDLPDDLSNLSPDGFDEKYFRIIQKTCQKLKNDRFACFVVGDYRGRDGLYVNFVGKTKQAFLDAGLGLYNSAILATPLGSAPMRSTSDFGRGRKLTKIHQNVLIFVKGDWKKAVEFCKWEW